MISRTTIWRANQLHHTHHITYRTVFCPTKYHRIKFCGSNEPGGIRTLDLRLRRPLLYQLSYRLISLTTPKTNCFRKAGDGNRTHVSSLEGWCSTIELHPRINCFLRFILYQNRSQSFQALRKRVMGIEPTYLAWKASVLPLNYTRIVIKL